MSTVTQFVVLKRDGRWSVRSKDLERHFSIPRKAIDAAIRLANDCGKGGKPSVVLFQKSKGQFERIWTYGVDPYPPAKSDLPLLPATPEPPKLVDALG